MRNEVIPQNRQPVMVAKRMVVAYFYRKDGLSLHQVGLRIGRNYSSVIYLLKRFKELLLVEDELILNEIKNYETQYSTDLVSDMKGEIYLYSDNDFIKKQKYIDLLC